MILCIDIGTKLGWAYEHDGQIESGMADFSNKRHEGGGMRYLKFKRWLDALPVTPTEVYYELVRRHKGTDAAHVYGGLLGTLSSWCEDNSVPYAGETVQAIKKHATGKGNAGKELMIAAANLKGQSSQDDNEVDAWWLLDMKLREGMLG